MTVNFVLNVHQYLLPSPDDVFATLAGVKYLSNLELSHTYNLIVLDDDT